MLKDLVVKSRSYRGYDESRRITEQELLELVDCARFAPSSVNGQPFCYLLLHEKEDTDRLQPLTGWAKALPGMKLPHPGKCPTAFAVAQTMLLAATEMGLGGIMIGNFSPAKVSEAMKLPETIVPMLIVAFGKPDEKIVLTEVSSGESIKYYRDDQDVHYVPKRKLEDIVIRANAEKYDK